MRSIPLVLVCVACVGLGRRMRTTNDQVADSSDSEHQSSHSGSNAAQTLHARASHSQLAPNKKSTAAALLVSLLLAFKPGADALTFSNRVAVTARGHTAERLAVTQHGLHDSNPLGLGHNRTDAPQLPREDWQNGNKWYSLFHREGVDDVHGHLYQTPTRYVGTRAEGSYKGSTRVTFTLPVNGEGVPPVRTVDFLVSKRGDRPSFAAVEVTLPLDVNVRSLGVANLQDRVVVTDVIGHAANLAEIRPHDMIRAVSMPTERSSAKPWWDAMGMRAEVQEGVAMLDNTGVSAYRAAIEANVNANGPNAKVVLLIERPVSVTDVNHNNWAQTRRQASHHGR